MSTAGETFNFIKRILLIDEHMTRLAADIEKVDSTLADHERRLVRIEVALTMAASPRRIVLP
ncbi:MAG: hypothetical protein ABI147_07210, partial [Acidobacteriaceae bacterium]